VRSVTLGSPFERFRIALGVFTTIYLTMRFSAFSAVSDIPAAAFEPVGALAWLASPLSRTAWLVLLVAALISSVAFTVGRGLLVIGPLHGLLLLTVTTYRSSWGQVLWFECLFVIHTLVVAVAVVVKISSRDALRLAAVATVVTYALAGVAKLRIGGLDWASGETLRNHIAFSAARLELFGASPAPLARPAVELGWILTPFAVGSLVVELGAPLALVSRRAAIVWSTAAWTMHATIAATMAVVFIYPLVLLAFVPVIAATQVNAQNADDERGLRPADAQARQGSRLNSRLLRRLLPPSSAQWH
jgi:hypothetical protein